MCLLTYCVIHAWAPSVWGTTKSVLYKYTYLYIQHFVGRDHTNRLTKSTSQIQSVPSLEPVASLLPSGENRQNHTSSLCWDNTWVVVHGNWSLNTTPHNTLHPTIVNCDKTADPNVCCGNSNRSTVHSILREEASHTQPFSETTASLSWGTVSYSKV